MIMQWKSPTKFMWTPVIYWTQFSGTYLPIVWVLSLLPSVIISLTFSLSIYLQRCTTKEKLLSLVELTSTPKWFFSCGFHGAVFVTHKEEGVIHFKESFGSFSVLYYHTLVTNSKFVICRKKSNKIKLKKLAVLSLKILSLQFYGLFSLVAIHLVEWANVLE